MHNVNHPVNNQLTPYTFFPTLPIMTPNEAFAVMAKLVAEHGTKAGIEKIATMCNVGWHTAYGWWRRGSVPDWRVPAFERKNGKKEAA